MYFSFSSKSHMHIVLTVKQFCKACYKRQHQCVVVCHAPPAGDLGCNPGMCSDWELNQQPFGSQAAIQSTEPHQPGPGSETLDNPWAREAEKTNIKISM